MSGHNVELVRRSLEAFARGDFDVAFAAFDPAVEWCTAADEPDQRTHRGEAGLRAFVDSLNELWENRFAPVQEFEDFIDRGDWVVVPWRATLRGRGSGIPVEVHETYAVQVKDGRILRVDEYRRLDQALASVDQPDPD